MNPDEEVEFDLSPFAIVYKSGRVQRSGLTSRKSAGTDATTGVTTRDVVIDAGTGLAARQFLPKSVPESQKLPVLVYFHGGAYVAESAFSLRYTSYVNALVAAARVVAVSVEHRLAPEHPLPAAYDDAWAALRWTATSCVSPGPETEPWLADHGDPTRILVAGNSSGGNMAHNVVMRAGKEGLRGGARIGGMVLLHPLFLGKAPVPSEGTDSTETAERNWRLVCAGKYGLDHPFSNPLVMPPEEWAVLGCRRALVTAAELDPSRDRARMYVEALRRSAWGGEEAALYETEGEGHMYYFSKVARSNPVVAEKAAKEMAAVVSFIKRVTCTSTSDCNIRSTL
ncbi:tuliposide A-converting enzyme b3, amyloplastic-like [Hordeum vulgare subsp. vulgare]|uniref:Alpha/beta hydrolase fold-3 domain-containing protein n=1 Tax=Hordeum vulgare subsp. vulgare TaxID=112509 RepID=A0A8I7B993_HORVV|nr:tuliposide A-converting enzyme b3, amyloplastic-like [Hordeum vulgare subsp. vulgare]